MNIINIGYHATNYYVIADKQPILLIDAGWPNSLPELQHAANRMGIRLDTIKYQLVTHYHPDHAGLVEELKRLGIKLIVIDTQLDGIPLLVNHVKPQDNFTPIQLAGATILRADQTRAFLSTIGIQGEIIPTPGHSDDSVTLILDEGAAFTGDLTPPMIVPDDPTDPAYQSWAKIRARSVHTIYAGHGPVGHI